MINSTLGGLIKDYRLQKGLSQFDIAFALGWKETSRLSRIEQGRTERPPRELVDKIISAIGLEEEEKNNLLLTGSYLPTEEEILKIKKETDVFLREWPYPAVVIDFSWRLINVNVSASELFGVSSTIVKDIYKSQLRILDMFFGSFKNKQESSMLRPLGEVISEFKYEQRRRTKEKWFIEHVRRLMENEFFRELWARANVRDTLTAILGKYEKKQFIHPKDKNKFLNFYLFVVPVLKDPRFEVELHVPMDLETYNFYR